MTGANAPGVKRGSPLLFSGHRPQTKQRRKQEMSKFNKPGTRKRGFSPIETDETNPTTTFEGAPAFNRTPQSELFLLGVTNFVSEKTYYETAKGRDNRFTQLVRTVAHTDGLWLAEFITWLRRDGNMRSAPLVAAAEYVHEHARYPENVPPVVVPKQR